MRHIDYIIIIIDNVHDTDSLRKLSYVINLFRPLKIIFLINNNSCFTHSYNDNLNKEYQKNLLNISINRNKQHILNYDHFSTTYCFSYNYNIKKYLKILSNEKTLVISDFKAMTTSQKDRLISQCNDYKSSSLIDINRKYSTLNAL